MDLGEHREDYVSDGLHVSKVHADPIAQFERWFGEAEDVGLWEPNAMVGSAVDPEGWPTSRMVLLKEVDQQGFVFYTNYESAKGVALDHSRRCALTFPWHQLRRQIRIQGHGQQAGGRTVRCLLCQAAPWQPACAWASPQSKTVDGREVLKSRYDEVEQRFADRDVPRPPNWVAIWWSLSVWSSGRVNQPSS